MLEQGQGWNLHPHYVRFLPTKPQRELPSFLRVSELFLPLLVLKEIWFSFEDNASSAALSSGGCFSPTPYSRKDILFVLTAASRPFWFFPSPNCPSFFFLGHTHTMWKFLCHSSNLSHRTDNTGFLICWATRECPHLWLWCYPDYANLIAVRWPLSLSNPAPT